VYRRCGNGTGERKDKRQKESREDSLGTLKVCHSLHRIPQIDPIFNKIQSTPLHIPLKYTHIKNKIHYLPTCIFILQNVSCLGGFATIFCVHKIINAFVLLEPDNFVCMI
jgi:hypothetical protein